ncbi:F-box/kelch-repeat protein At3g23880-like [Spinacia oleracea]|uniref:F-box/kelch-repeat protein At3g23880-like n=1 Tax=Spinacia oleracea TaxID=3562 RepID=A0ABM3REB7_SPIOL|nr:F-box/kelch-repeat protein At3g23880-like [Spinacia oleracea]
MAEAKIIDRGRLKFVANYDHIDGCLPLELTLEILVRLPTKSLVRFKLVSKSWYSVISNPNFIKFHTLNSNKPFLTLLYDSSYRLRKCLSLGKRDDNVNLNSTVLEVNPSSFLHTQENLGGLIGSCHGLICTYSDDKKLIYLCNPATKETKEISFPYPKTQSYYYSRIMSWFGFVPSINDYKILLVFGIISLRIHVYSMRDNKWRKVDSNAFESLVTPGGCIRWGSNAALINEKLHFYCFDTNLKNKVMAKFDLVQEIFEIHPRGRVVEAWKLEKYGKWDSWNKLFSVELSGFLMGFTSFGGLILKRITYDIDDHELVFVDVTQNAPSQIQLGRTEGVCYMLDYVETLVSPFSLP